MTDGRDTTADSISYDPGTTIGRDISGNLVPVPEPKVPVTGPSVDKEELTDDNSEVEKLVEEVKEDQQDEKPNDQIATG